jgi:hypothetical protein
MNSDLCGAKLLLLPSKLPLALVDLELPITGNLLIELDFNELLLILNIFELNIAF